MGKLESKEVIEMSRNNRARQTNRVYQMALAYMRHKGIKVQTACERQPHEADVEVDINVM